MRSEVFLFKATVWEVIHGRLMVQIYIKCTVAFSYCVKMGLMVRFPVGGQASDKPGLPHLTVKEDIPPPTRLLFLPG